MYDEASNANDVFVNQSEIVDEERERERAKRGEWKKKKETLTCVWQGLLCATS